MNAFDEKKYASIVNEAVDFLKNKLPKDFKPQVTLTLGSGLNGVLNDVELVCNPIAYADIPGFLPPTAPGHVGRVLFGYLQKVPVMIFQGRKHYYELVGIRDFPLRDVVFPIYVARGLGAKIYFATNAAGGINTTFKPGDLMLITSHFSLFYPNPLLGPVIPLFDSPRFPPQDKQYDKALINLFKKSANELNIEKFLHTGIYVALTGPTFESNAEILMLRKMNIDAVGMSTVPEIMAATSVGMKTIGLSLITNATAEDGTNAATAEEVLAALDNPITKKRIEDLLQKFFQLLSQEKLD